MKFQTFPLPIAPIDSKLKPVVTTVQPQNDGTVLVGLLFAKPALFRVTLQKNKVVKTEDMKIEDVFDKDFLGITGGLRGTRTGDTAFATLHKGGSGFFSMFKKGKFPQTPEEVRDDIANELGGLGFSYKHSLVQIFNNKFQVRRNKEPGVLLDAAHIGDFIFGLGAAAIFREPYLNAEKRYMLREDLEANYRFNKVDDGVFWLRGAENRLLKVGLTDNKAIPTTKRLPAGPTRDSVDSFVDGWLYMIVGQTIVRIRVNPENRLDEIQEIKTFEKSLPLSVTASELEVKQKKKEKEEEETTFVPRKGKVWISTTTDEISEIFEINTENVEDNEVLPPLPAVTKVFENNALVNLGNLIDSNGTLLGSCQLKTGETCLFLADV